MADKQIIDTTPLALMADLNAAQKALDDNEKLIEKYEAEYEKIYELISAQIDERNKLRSKLEETKREATNLKKFIWSSNDQNIVELRNQLLMAAKLIK